MDNSALKATKELISFIERAPDSFNAVAELAHMLELQGFTRLSEADEWELERGCGYYVTRNSSSIIAFRIPNNVDGFSFMIGASHTDSPTFKLKDVCEKKSAAYVTLNVESYGGAIISSWFDRPLSVSGRAVLRRDGRIACERVRVDRDLLILPSLAIHLDRGVNDGRSYNVAQDVLPLCSTSASERSIYDEVCTSLGCERDALLGADLYLYNRTAGTILGTENEMFAAPRIDNLMCAYTTLRGFIDSKECDGIIPIWCSFDNEETGSQTKQGAASPFLYDTLERICSRLGTELCRVLPSSFMVSADNGHALHPTHPEQSDSMNAPRLNGGVVIKYNASQKYTTDALSAVIFKEICSMI